MLDIRENIPSKKSSRKAPVLPNIHLAEEPPEMAKEKIAPTLEALSLLIRETGKAVRDLSVAGVVFTMIYLTLTGSLNPVLVLERVFPLREEATSCEEPNT